MAGYWLKLYTEILEDPKYNRMSDNTKIGMYELLLVAKRFGDDGSLPPIEDVAFYTRRTVEWWQVVYDELRSIEFLVSNGHDVIIRKFSERQAAISDAQRHVEYRKRKHSKEFDAVTEPVTNRDGDIEIEKEIDTDTEKELSDGGADAPAAVVDPEFYVYSKITGFTSFPGAWVKATDNARLAIRGILMEKRYDKQAAIDYLMPFWEEYRKRNLPPSQFHWLDWAVTGTIPALRAPPGKANQKPAEIDPKEYM